MKISKIYTVLAAAVLGLSACNTPDTPVLQAPTTFELNVPPFAAQYYQLTPEGTLEFTCSQPDYGVGTQVNYSAQVSLTPDFAECTNLTNINGASATIAVKQEDVAIAVCEMLGVTDEDTWQPFVNNHVMPLFFRAVAQIGEIGWTNIASNVVELPNVDFYYALKTPAFIYLVGSPSGWTEPSEGNMEFYRDWRLYEADDAIGSNVYSAVFDIPASPAFRFATELLGWEAGFVGCAGGPDGDSDVPCTFTEGVYNGSLAVTKDKFSFPDWAGGDMTITVDLNKMTVTIAAGAQEVVTPKYVYMVGNNAGWAEPSAASEAIYEPWRLECLDGSGIYTGTFTLAMDADDLYCRFYKELTGWGAAQWASVTGENYAVTPGVAAPTAAGEGCFLFEGANGNTISVSLDTNNNKVVFDFVD